MVSEKKLPVVRLLLLVAALLDANTYAFIPSRSLLGVRSGRNDHITSTVLFEGGATLSGDVKLASSNSSEEQEIASLSVENENATIELSLEESLTTTSVSSSDDDSKQGPQSSKSIIGVVAVGGFCALAVLAKIGILPGPPLEGGSYGTYTDAMIGQDIAASTVSAIGAYAFVKGSTWLAANGYLDPKDSRKLIHTLSAPIFVLLWPLFSPAVGARFFAGVVCLANIIRLYLAGTGQDKSLAYAVSRTGDAKEALEGPFLYVLILQAAILLFWRTSPVGVVAVTTMAAGDGLADLIGRRLGKNNKWWFSPNKSVAGTLAFWIGGTLSSVGILSWLQFTGCLSLPAIPSLAVEIAAITAVAAFFELVDFVDDNWSVPLSAAILTAVFLH